jgi:trimeric autotransporter adhesin
VKYNSNWRGHAEGIQTAAEGHIHTQTGGATANGEGSHAEGDRTTAAGDIHTQKVARTTSTGAASHAEGASTTAVHTQR